MIRRSLPAWAFALALAACSRETPPPPTALPAAPRPAPAPAPAAGLEREKPERRLPAATYEARGRHDPFETLDAPSGPQGLSVAATRLTGIVRSPRGTLALLEGTDGIGYILKAGDTLGDGRLLEIGADSAVFNVVPRASVPPERRTPAPPTRVTLRLRTDS